MAAHAPWGAGNDPPQALPGGNFFLVFTFFSQQKLTITLIFFLILTWDLYELFVQVKAFKMVCIYSIEIHLICLKKHASNVV